MAHPAPAPAAHDQRDHVGVMRQKDGANALGFALRTGRVSGTLLAAVADLADRYGRGRVRTTVQQKLVVLDVADDDVEPLVAALAEHDLQVRPSAFRRGTMACTGLEFCKLAIVETKQHAQDVASQAARVGAEQVSGDIVSGNAATVNFAAARYAAQQYLHAAGLTGSVNVADGNTIEVTTAETYDTTFLGLLGINRLKVTGDATAQLIRAAGGTAQ